MVGITEKGIIDSLLESNSDMLVFDIGAVQTFKISGKEVKQYEKLKKKLESSSINSDYKTAYNSLIEEVAYTWFNRLVAIRFMEANNYLPDKMRVLFHLLFIKQCNALNKSLPELFERTDDYAELLLTISYNDPDGVVYKLVHDIPGEYFDIE